MRFTVVALFFIAQAAFAVPPDGGGALAEPRDDGAHGPAERALHRARAYAQKLHAQEAPTLQAGVPAPPLQWPARKAVTASAAEIQAISNFVDQDASEAGILDFDCGDRTYDGHRGLDIFIAPYPWYKMERDEGIVVAAASGTIVDKVGDQQERSCSVEDPPGENNQIIIEHADGSFGVYAHMRTGSLTAKPMGATVTAGEYLGVIGSAGNSTGPHLHFEVGVFELEGGEFVWRHRDPYAGTCNDLNVESWWAEQPAYYHSALLDIATHNAAPEIPECPQTEMPHYNDSFSAGDTVFLAIYLRDQLRDQQADLTIRMPNGNVFTNWSFAEDTVEHYSASYWYWSIGLPGNAPSGEWTFSVQFEGQSLEHSFWVDASPEPAPTMPVANNAYNGLWYDPLLDGEGYNIITASVGTVIYFYGSDSDSRRLWLISEVVTETIADGSQLTILMYESTGGTHAAPVGSARGLSVWGELLLTFNDCNGGTAVLRGVDGEKTSMLVKLAGVPGTTCVGEATADSPYSGLWFDLALEGEGFNAIVTPFGAVIYYYGFDAAGDRLWMIAGPISQTLQVSQEVTVDIYKATGGSFDAPVPSDQALVVWGALRLLVNSCSSMTITTDTTDGLKVSATVRLVGVAGLECVD